MSRTRSFRALWALALLAAPLPLMATAAPTHDNLALALSRAAPAANPQVLALATRALRCVQRTMPTRTLSVIDYSLPSTERRLWVFDLARRQLLFKEWVAHGRNTGDNLARQFSNTPGSLMSSLGTFVTDGTYVGHNGYSLRLRGLEPGFNDKAESRAIVIHGARYVSNGFLAMQGRLGRSYGCPAVRPQVAHQLIEAIAKRSVVFAYYPDRRWLAQSHLLGDCGEGVASTLRQDATHAP